MIKLIVHYNVGDEGGCWDIDSPVLYESKEKFIFDFELALESAFNAKKFNFQVGDYHTDLNGLSDRNAYYMPEIYTLDEWFNMKREMSKGAHELAGYEI